MKVQKELSIYMGDSTRAMRRQELEGQQSGKGKKKNVFAGELNGTQDNILLKKQQAQKQALKVVTDTWSGDKKIDDDVKERRERIKSLREEVGNAQKELNEIAEQQEVLRKRYGVDADSEEQKDLELLLKSREAKRNPKVSLTKEEQERLAEIEGQERTEYQNRVLELDSFGDYHRDIISKAKQQIEIENNIIRETKLERLKKDPMLDAQKQADAIEEAANKEILGMLVDEGKEHIDKEQEEKKEQAAEAKEKKEEQEELLAKRKDERKEAEKRAEELAESLPVAQLLDLDKTQEELNREIQNIVDKMKLIEEDIKGAAVDTTL
ncbi:MAG: hypothetical protein HDQ99_18060 [Lachnospiraceae bacterium]|nr:hypothetical protein [Lachnospiraceae bacterium]